MPLVEYALVRTRIEKEDDQRRLVAAGAIGTIVHAHETKPDDEPAYVVEVVITDARGVQVDAHLIDALASELELIVAETSRA